MCIYYFICSLKQISRNNIVHGLFSVCNTFVDTFWRKQVDVVIIMYSIASTALPFHCIYTICQFFDFVNGIFSVFFGLLSVFIGLLSVFIGLLSIFFFILFKFFIFSKSVFIPVEKSSSVYNEFGFLAGMIVKIVQCSLLLRKKQNNNKK